MKKTNSQNFWYWVVAALIFSTLAVIAAIVNIGGGNFGEVVRDEHNREMIVVGGVPRPRSDIERDPSFSELFSEHDRRSPSGKDSNTEKATPKLMNSEDRLPIVTAKDSPQVQQIVEKIKAGGEETKSLNPILAPAPFDLEEFKNDPEAYVKVFAPNRVWQTAGYDKNVPALKSITRGDQTMTQGESIRLKVRSVASSPVTFTTFDTGFFQNRLPSITVLADREGNAEVNFTAGPGTIGDVNIAAASPMASGMLRFRLFVQKKGDSSK